MASKTSHGAAPLGPVLVIVESPTKARTLGRFLGKPYIVEASVGHVRDLVERKADLAEGDERRSARWVNYGVNLDNHFEPLEEIYFVPPDKKRQIDTLKAALKTAGQLYLATDDDREGEAISWHLREVLDPKRKVPTSRLVFHEITKEAIDHAIAHPRPLDEHLVVAQRARRIVDRLYGWDVSRLLWGKIKPSLSAGRVQSVALRMLVERERQRIAFVTAAWWDVTGRFAPQRDATAFDAGLLRVGDRKLADGRDFDDVTGQLKDPRVLQLDEAGARALAERLAGRPARVKSKDVRPQTLRPYPPFTTSTLQQEANRKLRMSARDAMRVAQQLYESGFITYMRTDSTTLSEQALQAARTLISAQYGPANLPPKPRRYQTKSANAQEAHEAIRPAGTHFQPVDAVASAMGRDAARLYDLIWKRTVASQMVDAQVEQTTLDIAVDDAVFRATGRVTRNPGFLLAYVEGSDDPEAALDARDRPLPALEAGDALIWGQPPVRVDGHETRPPARLTDASLVKSLEEQGIGRPSTYAAILQNLLDKEYAFRKGQALVPTFLGMAVVAMLEKHMPHLVDYGFTAEMESRLDAVARGEAKAGAYLRAFYEDGFAQVGDSGPVPGLSKLLETVRDRIDPAEASAVPIGSAPSGEAVVVRIGRFGAFVKIGDRTASVPEEQAPDELTVARAVEMIEARQKGDAPLGTDPTTGEAVYLRNGRFGWYLQLGGPANGSAKTEDGAKEPRRVSLSKGMEPGALDLETALAQLALPRELGDDPRTGKAVVAKTGRFGDFVESDGQTRSLDVGVLAARITLTEALAALRQPKAGQRAMLRALGTHADKAIELWNGRYGPYVTDGAANKTLPKGTAVDGVTLAHALALLDGAAAQKAGRTLGKDPDGGGEVRLLDGRFGPYVTNGTLNASLARGTQPDDLTLEGALDRLRHFGKPPKAKPRRGTKRAATGPRTGAQTGKRTAKQAAPAKTVAAKNSPKAKSAATTTAARSRLAPEPVAAAPVIQAARIVRRPGPTAPA